MPFCGILTQSTPISLADSADGSIGGKFAMFQRKRRPKAKLSSLQIIALGFLIIILTGTCLLMLPWSTQEPGGASFGDAIFTATSATCVTGLVVQDTGTYWSLFGQIVLLIR